ncbi:MAG: hypothetical protein E7058_03350 [Lentisphaerae bacterium]|nr:hypothetical protein [Lentisphaerota bacterium]
MKKLIRPAMLVVPLAVGMFFPEVKILAYPPYNVIRWALCVMIFINVLQIRFADLKPRKEHGILLAANILLGVVPFYLLKYLCPGTVIPAQAAFFTGIAPTAAASAVIVSLLNGNVGFAVTAFVISNAGISLALLGLLPLITGDFTVAFFYQVAQSLVTVIVLPLLLAQITGKIFPGIMKHLGKLKMFSLSLWSLSLFIMAGIARSYFDRSDAGAGMIAITGIIAVVICIMNFALGYLLTGRFRRESSQMLGQKNTTFALYLALQYASGEAALATVFYVLCHNLWNSIQLFAFPGEVEPVSPDVNSGTDAER